MAKKDKNTDEDTPKKGGALKLILGAVLLLGAGAGGAYGAFAAGLVGSAGEDAGPDLPELVQKGQSDPFAPANASGGKDGAGEAVFGEGGSKYRRLYYSFEDSFTSNLKNSAGIVQLSVAASTKHDGRVIQWLERHELAIRSAMLVEIAATPEEEIYTAEGKDKLQKRLTAAVNRVLTEQEGFGGVDEIHFRTFLVQ